MVHEVPNVQTNFSSGELDPLVRGRNDSGAYANGLERALNVTLYNTGGCSRRPGTQTMLDLGLDACRVIPFEYSDLRQYLIVLSQSQLRIYDLDGVLLVTFTGPWTTEQLFNITYSQLGDSMVLCHRDWMPQVLNRTNITTWTFSVFAFETSPLAAKVYQPYEKFAQFQPMSMIPHGVSGTFTLQSTMSFFTPEHVGTRIRIFDAEVTVNTFLDNYNATVTANATIEGKMQLNPFRTIRASSTIQVTHVGHNFGTGTVVTFTGANDILTSNYGGSGTVNYSTISADQLNGAHTIVVIDEDRYQFEITLGGSSGPGIYSTVDGGGGNVKFNPAGKPILQWREQLFSAARGFPQAVCFHEQRLWFGGTPWKPDGLWSSLISRYYNFDVGTGGEAESIQASIGSDLGSVIRHLTSNRHLQIYTTTSELYCPPPNNSSLTPASFRVAPQTRYGANKIRPSTLDGATIYVQANNKTVRENVYTDTEQAYTSTSVSLLAAHLINDPVDMAVLRGSAARGEQMACFVNADGTCAVFISARSEKMAGWVPWTMCGGDKFTSVCAINSSFYFIVKRSLRWYLERLTADDTLTIDGAHNITGPPATSWFVPMRFASRMVAVVSGDWYVGEFLVSSGGLLTVPEDAPLTTLTVGFFYAFHMKTLPAAVETPRGKRVGQKQRIAEAVILFNQTVAATIQGQRMILRHAHHPVEETPPRITGPMRFFFKGYAREAQLEITQAEPLPLRILYIRAKVVA
jgi:hypothetical protein